MTKKASPTLIGVFIFAGLILAVAGVLLFTSSKFFTPTAKYIIYFQSSLNGLNEGAPVKYRGVTIGTVSRVMIRFNQATNDWAMPVIIEMEEDLIRNRLVGVTTFKGVSNMSDEIRHGLRARLETESLVTGVLYVDLEVEQSPPPATFHQLKPVYPEIPSRPTDIQKLKQSLAKVDLGDLVNKVDRLLNRAETLLDQLKMDDINNGLTNVLSSANRLVSDPNLTNSFASLKEALDRFRQLAETVNSRVDPLVGSVTTTLDKLNLTLVQTRGSMQNLRDLLAADSALRYNLNDTLNQLGEAAQSVSALADYLHDHPNALLTGRKRAPEEKP